MNNIQDVNEYDSYFKNQIYFNLGYDICDVFADGNAALCGGALTCIYNNLPINDYDIYFTNPQDLYWVYGNIRSKGIIESEQKTKYATTIFVKPFDTLIKIQLISKPSLMMSSTFNLINTFDFTICMAAFNFKSGKFTCHSKFIIHNKSRTLEVNPANTSMNSTLFRIRKYLNRHFTINYGMLEHVIDGIKIYRKNTTKLQRRLLRLKYRNELFKIDSLHYPWDTLSFLTEKLDNRFLDENLDNSDGYKSFY